MQKSVENTQNSQQTTSASEEGLELIASYSRNAISMASGNDYTCLKLFKRDHEVYEMHRYHQYG